MHAEKLPRIDSDEGVNIGERKRYTVLSCKALVTSSFHRGTGSLVSWPDVLWMAWKAVE